MQYQQLQFLKEFVNFYILLFDTALICARTSRAAKKYPTNMLVMEIIEMSSILKCCHIYLEQCKVPQLIILLLQCFYNMLPCLVVTLVTCVRFFFTVDSHV